jgi:CheY-like chemotaxis protein
MSFLNDSRLVLVRFEKRAADTRARVTDKVLEGLDILLVEEEVLIAMDIEQICYEQGASTVVTISSGAMLTSEALDLAEARYLGVDAAILDARVGGEWSAELARRLRERRIPFVFATGYTSAEPFFAEFPDVGVITKPYAGLELAKALAAAIDRARSNRG